jgi:hypothetical protein
MRGRRKTNMEKQEKTIEMLADECIELVIDLVKLPRKERRKLAASLPPEQREFLLMLVGTTNEALIKTKELKHSSDADPDAIST